MSLILVPAVFALLYVHAFGVSVVFSDAWSMVPLFHKYFSGTLSPSDLFAQHNEHRMVFPEATELLLGILTRYDNVAEMYLIEVCFLVTLIFLLLAFRNGTKPWLVLFLPASLLIFSFRQYENMLFGYQINFAFTQTFGVIALFLLYKLRSTRLKRSTFGAALASATVASFSTAQGLFVWPAGLLQLFIGLRHKPTKRVSIAVWSLVGLVEWVAYFSDYSRPRNSPPLSYALDHPATAAQYFLNLLGSSLFWQQSRAFAGGLAISCLALISLLLVFWWRKSGEYSFWVSLLLYSLLMLAAITLGRSGVFGIWQALAPRYTTFSILTVVATYAMLARGAFEKRSFVGIALAAGLSGAVLVSAVVSYSLGTEIGEEQKISREQAAFVLYTYRSEPGEALKESLYPSVKVLRERASILQRLRYNVFSDPQAPKMPPPLSRLSPLRSTTPSAVLVTGAGVRQQNRTFIIPKRASYVEVLGWAVDAQEKLPAGGVYLGLDGKLFPAFYGMDRQDVANQFGVPSYRYSGFEREIPASKLKPGVNRLSVIVLRHDKKAYYRSDLKVTLKRR